MPHENEVAVHREDLRFRVIALDLDREHRFLNFAPETFLRFEEEVLAELLRKSAAAFGCAAFHQISEPCARDPEDIDAPVLFEILIFDRDDGIADSWRNILRLHQDAPLE